MKSFDSRTYSVNDFREWHLRDQLVLAPKFQRREVWTDKARSFLIDTIIRERPLPKFFIRQVTDLSGRATSREVVDGQQRLRTILLYVSDSFPIMRIHNPEFGGQFFSGLPEDTRHTFLEYELSVDLLIGATDQDVLDIFSRLNSYGVSLNQQEKLNAKYFGDFKQSVYEMSLEFLSFWQNYKIFSDRQILRMEEALLTSELFIAMTEGIQSRKAIESYYKRYDERFPRRDVIVDHFRRTMDVIGNVLEIVGRNDELQSPVAFYSVFCSFFHMNFSLPSLSAERIPIRARDFGKAAVALSHIADLLATNEQTLNPESRAFASASRRHTTDEAQRSLRSEFICRLVADCLRA